MNLRMRGSKNNAPRLVSDIHTEQLKASRKRFRLSFIYSKNGSSDVVDLRTPFPLWKKIGLSGALALVLVFALLAQSAWITKADVAQFYSTKCLGSWQNPGLAEGEPDTVAGTSTFSVENSAVLLNNGASTSLQIFCGGFLPVDYERKGVIDHIGLTMHWQMEFQPRATTSEEIATTTEATAATSVILNGSEESQGADSSQAPAVGEARSLERQNDSAATAESTPAKEPDQENNTDGAWLIKYFALQAFAEEVPQATEPQSAEVITAESAVETTASEQDTVQAPEQAAEDNVAETTQNVPTESETASPEEAAPALSSEESPNDSVADASTTPTNLDTAIDSNSFASSSEESLESGQNEEPTGADHGVADEISGEVLGVSADDQSEDSATSSGSETAVTTTTVGETASSVAEILEINPKDGFLLVRYSLDGTNWFNLEQVSRDNWSNFAVNLPINTWDELQALQISIEEISDAPDKAEIVYVDGAVIEVHYDLPVFLGDVLPDTHIVKQIENLAETLDIFGEKAPAPEPVYYVREAEQSCAIEPFTKILKRGGETEYKISLIPSGKARDVKLLPGNLPKGLNVRFGSDSVDSEPQEMPLYVFADSDARLGSFNISIVYEELFSGNYKSLTVCQFNPVIE